MMKADHIPPKDCLLCPRLVEYRRDNQAENPDWFNGAVAPFGDPDPWLLVVGLAPGVRGANRTGRPFTGDYAGDLLYATLGKVGLSNDKYGNHVDDGLELKGVQITNVVRCVPPQNKPTTEEVHTCRPFLIKQLEALPKVKALILLGQIAHQSTLKALGLKQSAYRFGHGAVHKLDNGLHLVDSYHCSRYNTNTGRLTEAMFEDVFKIALSLR